MFVRRLSAAGLLLAVAGCIALDVQAQAPARTVGTTEAPASPKAGPFNGPTWGIVVASTTDRAAAVAVAREQQAQGRPSAVAARVDGGRVRYRVFVGRYASPEAAAEALRALAPGLPADAWVFRQDTAWRVPLSAGAARQEQP